MGMDVAQLSLQIDSSGLKTGDDTMSHMVTTSGMLEDAIKKVAAAWASWKIAEHIQEAATLAARYETLGVVMGVVGNNAGYTRAQMDAYAASLQRAGISMVESRSSLATMAQSHIDLAKATQLGRLAQDAAVIGNMNSSEAFKTLVHGIQEGRTETLRSIGINVNFENSYKALADATGRTVQELTEQEKITIRTNAVLEKAKDLNGAYEASMETAGKQLLSMTRYAEDLETVFGSLFSNAFGTAVGAINQSLQDMKQWLTDNAEAARNMNYMLGTAAGNFVGLVKDVLGVASSMSKVDDELSIGEILAGGLALSMAVVRDVVMAAVGAVQTLWGGIEKAISGAFMAASELLNLLVAFQPPDWVKTLWEHGNSTMAAGQHNLTTSATARLYEGGNSLDEVNAEQAKAARDRAAEQARIQAGTEGRAADAAAAKARERADAARALADAVQQQNQALERERLQFERGSEAAFAYDLSLKGITGTSKLMILAKYDALEAEKALAAQMDRDAASGRNDGEALAAIMNQAVEAAQAVGKSTAELTRMRLLDAGATEEQVRLTLDWVNAASAQQAQLDHLATLQKDAARLNSRDDYQTRMSHLNDLNSTGLLTGDTYSKELLKNLKSGDSPFAPMINGVETFGNSAADAFGKWSSGMDTAAIHWSSMIRSMIADMASLFAKQSEQQLFSYLFGNLGSLFGSDVPGGSISDTAGIGQSVSPTTVPTSYASMASMAAPAAASHQVAVTINNNGTVSSKVQSSDGAAQMGQVIDAKVREGILAEQRPGGLLNPL